MAVRAISRPVSQVARARPDAAARPWITPMSLPGLLIAGFMFYLPLAHVPPAKALRLRVVHTPVLDNPYEKTVSLDILLLPEFVFAVALLGVLLLGGYMRSKGERQRSDVLFFSAAALMLGGALTGLTGSAFPGVSANATVTMLTAFLVGGLVLRCRANVASLRFWAIAAIAGMAVTCLIGAVVFYRDFGIPGSLSALPSYRFDPLYPDYQRVTYGHSSNTAGLLVIAVGLSVGLFFSRGASAWLRAFLCGVLLLLLANLAIAFQRWGWLAIVGILLLTIVYWRHSIRSLVTFAGLVALTLLIGQAISIELGDYFNDAISTPDGSSLTVRRALWEEGIDLIRQDPFGHGLNTAGKIPQLTATSSHNTLIDFGVEGGVLEMGGGLIWTATIFWTLAAHLRRPDRRNDFAFALLLGVAAFSVYGVFFNIAISIGGVFVWLAFWLILPAIALNHSRLVEEAAPQEDIDATTA